MRSLAALLLGLTAIELLGAELLRWSELPPLPIELGVAGPHVGTHNGALIVAGGANFPQPVWETEKQWHDDIFVLTEDDSGTPSWRRVGALPNPVAYAACVSTPSGVLCMGGNDENGTFDTVYALQWVNDSVQVVPYPPLPSPCAFGDATVVGNTVYLAGGQSGRGDDTVMGNFWQLELAFSDQTPLVWKELPSWDGPPRVHNLTIAQQNGYDDAVYVISGRRRRGDSFEFLKDVWEYTPRSASWRRRADVPQCVMAASGLALGQSHLFVFGGDDGTHFLEADELRDRHPGFPSRAFAFHTITNTWVDAGTTPQNHVTTKAAVWNGQMVIPSGEVRPRVRTPAVRVVEVLHTDRPFGALNYVVLFTYLATVVLVGLICSRRNRNTDDYFRGGGQMPWWAVGCSIYATMLSSLTFTGIPSKAFQQDWVLAVGNFTIPLVAIVAVYLALPFYRGINATSAYEYLELRFNRKVRLLGSLSFVLFHLFRMAVVMSLTGLALAVATPLTPLQSVLLIGVLCIVYCTLGGIEAVIWTDTVQTLVLLSGACAAVVLIVMRTEGGLSGMLQLAAADGKLNWANLNWDITSTQIAVWFVVIGGIAQNLSSYTADQAVVQRYMTTPTQQLAARSIWTNALLSIPTTILFFGIGSALYCFYRTHPERLDATIVADQVFPLFIAREMPAGIAGLIVAGIFAAAQSTVSTSMNSAATSVITDWVRPWNLIRNEMGYLRAARSLTLGFGIVATGLAWLFVDPQIKSLFDTFIKVIGIFMGVLGGLFLLGALTRRATGFGAIIGTIVGAATMYYLSRHTQVTFYLYTCSGIVTCFVVGYAASWLGHPPGNLQGLTIYSLQPIQPNRETS